MKKLMWLLAFAVCILSLPTGCSREASSAQTEPSAAASDFEATSMPESSAPQQAATDDSCVIVNGTRYLLTEQTSVWPDETAVEYAAISAVVGQPSQDGEANFGTAKDVLYRRNDPAMPDDITLFWRDGALLRQLFPTGQMRALGRALTAEEQCYADNVAALADALEQKDAAALSALMQTDDSVTTMYRGPLEATELTVLQTVYVSGVADKFYGMYSAWIDVEVTKSTMLPLGRQRLVASFRNDPRKGHSAGSLPLGSLTVEGTLVSPYPKSDPDSFGWNEVSDMVTLRVDMEFLRPEEISPRLLLRMVVPYAYRRAVWEGNGTAGPLTPQRIAEAAEVLYGIQGFSCEDADYFDAATGNYTLANHNRVTAGMGNAMDYIDPGINFSFDYGDGPDGFRYVTIVHYVDPLHLMTARTLEYKVEKVTDKITGELVGRVLSARKIQ